MMHDDEQLMELRRQCVELLFDCPAKRCVDACPFRAIRQRDVVDRVMWLKGLGLPELMRVVEQHKTCDGGHSWAAGRGCQPEPAATPQAKGTDGG